MTDLIRCSICKCLVPVDELCDEEGACTECCTCTYYSHDWPPDEGEDD